MTYLNFNQRSFPVTLFIAITVPVNARPEYFVFKGISVSELGHYRLITKNTEITLPSKTFVDNTRYS